MLATSDNLTAEMLVKEIGVAVAAERHARGGSAGDDRPARTRGAFPPPAWCFTDGSGLSHDNQLTCAALGGVLQRGSATDGVGAGLAVAGQDGSTLAGSFEQDGSGGRAAGQDRHAAQPQRGEVAQRLLRPAPDEVEFVLILNGAAATDVRRPRGTSWRQRCWPPPPAPQRRGLAPLPS